MKTSGTRRALVLAHVFNLLVAIYFIIISIISLVKLRWYHQLTITVKVRQIVTSATSYFAFIILIVTAIILIAIFVLNAIKLTPKTYINSNQDATTSSPIHDSQQPVETAIKQRLDENRPKVVDKFVIKDSISPQSTTSSICCSILLHLIASILLVIILVVWLLNSGELVRDSISTQLESAFAKYQYTERSNHYSIAIEGMQYINSCCGSLDYTDFPRQRTSQLSNGYYPGTCCGKSVYGVLARERCSPEEVVRAKQTVS